MAPQYVPVNAYSGAPSGGLVAMHQQQQAHPPQQFPFNLNAYTTGASNGLLPAFATNYIQQRSHLPMKLENNGDSYHHNQHRGFIEQHLQMPIIKEEQQQWRNSPPYIPAPVKTITPIPATSGAEADFGTEVDTHESHPGKIKHYPTTAKVISSPADQTCGMCSLLSMHEYNMHLPVKVETGELYS